MTGGAPGPSLERALGLAAEALGVIGGLAGPIEDDPLATRGDPAGGGRREDAGMARDNSDINDGASGEALNAPWEDPGLSVESLRKFAEHLGMLGDGSQSGPPSGGLGRPPAKGALPGLRVMFGRVVGALDNGEGFASRLANRGAPVGPMSGRDLGKLPIKIMRGLSSASRRHHPPRPDLAPRLNGSFRLKGPAPDLDLPFGYLSEFLTRSMANAQDQDQEQAQAQAQAHTQALAEAQAQALALAQAQRQPHAIAQAQAQACDSWLHGSSEPLGEGDPQEAASQEPDSSDEDPRDSGR